MNPNHGPRCWTKTYPAKCWHCRSGIFVHQCACGSVVLFDALGNGWPRHRCGRAHEPPRRILSDLERERQRLRDRMAAIQPGKEQWIRVEADRHRRSAPRRFAATLQVPPTLTKRITSLDAENALERAALKLVPGAPYAQITLRDTSGTEIYPAIVNRNDLPEPMRRNMQLGVTLEARGLRRAEWFVAELVILSQPEPAGG